MNQIPGAVRTAHSLGPDLRAAPDAETTLKDPVCGMTVTPDSKHSEQHAGRPVYFCSAVAKRSSLLIPASTAPRPAAVSAPPIPVPESAVPGTVYTCPMHPEVRQDHPGACPKCGMALEPEMPRSMTARAPS